MEIAIVIGAAIALLLLAKFGGIIMKALFMLVGVAIIVSALAYFYYMFFTGL